MASNLSPSAPMLTVRDRSVPWFKETVDVPDIARKLLEQYSGIAPELVESHMNEMRKLAWDVAPYPCLGGGTLWQLGVSQLNCYNEVLHRIKDGDRLLDVGCCLGQDLRKLAFDGAPSKNLYGTELTPGLVEAGYDLFCDKGRFQSTFIVGDFFDDLAEFRNIEGSISIIYAGSFLHLFGWDQQVLAATRFVSFLKPQEGSMVVGRQMGHLRAGSYSSFPLTEMMFKHDVESFRKLWEEVGAATNSKWHVEAQLEEMPLAGFTKGGQWGDPDGRRLAFIVRRQA